MDNSSLAITEVVQDEGEYLSKTWDSALFWLNAVVVPLLGCVGFVFNIFGILTLSYMGITSSSTMYMLIICIGDIISGFVDSILTVGIGNWYTNLYALSRFSCKFLMWINYATTCSTQFVLTLFTFDRLLAVTYPMKYRSLKTNLRYPVICSAVVVTLTYLSLIGNMYAFDLVDGQCAKPTYMSELGKEIYFHYSASFIYCGLPSTLIFIFNFTILYQMRKNDKNKKSSSTKSGREQAITRILLLMSFAFLLFTAGCMFFLYTSVIYLGPQLDGGDPWVGQMYVAMAQLQELPSTANVSFNFSFYLMGSKMFRKGFLDMLQSYFCCRKAGRQAEMTRTGASSNNNINADM
ncbi:galanin receptor 2b-like [Symsagittifera roscoffensis]|uniref:galanin receptor 2b-like n=1 Tax=Symsagittifera roscoffensis TaxID=84072 RepID=UPI00307CC4EA